MRWRSALVLLATLCSPAAGRAEPLRAVYAVQAAGIQIVRAEVLFDLSAPSRYRIESRLHLTGLVSWFSSGRVTSRAEGVWAGDAARPSHFTSEGTWRGEPRQVVLDYPGGQPALRRLIPAHDPDREPVPPPLQSHTIDSLSALAQLSRTLEDTGRCEDRAAIFDGRRRGNVVIRTLGRDYLPPHAGAWSGEAVRCGFIARQIAGFRHDDGADAREPQEGVAWMARPRPGAPILPVRVEMPGRWLGRLTAYLVELGPG
ncbi:DUF3108 domain-containing protein [Roseomonas sp. E05]|uniref:DUF3108 domain-containing protein n=1 Tax=Roseomonas sp. E05 TaxID=3046310 RepID=UPI0024BABF06|nr:DUF3108 domain-containing protein [Roseomonas sp. E05]MDJ0389438.1 DUF3108 domain-containing protein [Roseomonas sp. E05]